MESLERRDMAASDLMEVAEEVYGDLPETRKTISNALREGEVLSFVDGTSTTANLCNMDPQSHLQIIIDSVVVLTEHFGLTGPEISSVLTASELTLGDLKFLQLAAHSLTMLDPESLPSEYRCHGFGYLVAKTMENLYYSLRYERFKSRKNNRKGGRAGNTRRYNSYKSLDVPDYETFEQRSHYTWVLSSQAWGHDQGLIDAERGRNMQRKRTAYTAFLKSYDKQTASFHGVGELALRHSIQARVMVGLLPAYFSEISTFNTKQKPAKDLQERYSFVDSFDNESLKSFFQSFTKRMSVFLGRDVSEPEAENYLCKVARRLSQSDASFRDAHRTGQPLFDFQFTQTRVIQPDGSVETVEGPVIAKFPFGNGRVAMRELCPLFRRSPKQKFVGSYDEANKFRLPAALVSPSTRVVFGFTVLQLEPLPAKSAAVMESMLGQVFHEESWWEPHVDLDRKKRANNRKRKKKND
jgi:hypothetical protein